MKHVVWKEEDEGSGADASLIPEGLLGHPGMKLWLYWDQLLEAKLPVEFRDESRSEGVSSLDI